MSATMAPMRVRPSQIAMYSAQFAIIRQTVSPRLQTLRETPARVLIAANRQFAGSSTWLRAETSAGAAPNALRQPFDQQRQRDPGAVDGRGRSSARIHASRREFRIRFRVACCHRNCEPYHDCPRRSSYTVGTFTTNNAQHEARNNRHSRWFRLRPDDQGRCRADLPDGRLFLRQRGARCGAVQSGGSRVSLHAASPIRPPMFWNSASRTRRRRRAP